MRKFALTAFFVRFARCLGWLALAALPCLPGPAVAAPEPAMIMPRAQHGLLVDIVRAGERLVAVGERGHVLYSDDSGQSWTQAPVPVSVLLTAVWFADARHGWAVGHDGMVIATSDGGASWQLQRDGVAAQAELDRARLAEAKRALAALEESAGGDPAAIEDARLDVEEAGERLAEPVYAPPLMDVWFADAGHGIAVGAYGSLLVTADGGRTWSDARSRMENPDELHYYAIASGGGGRLLIVGESGIMFRSRDGGEHWEPLPAAYAGTLFGAFTVPPGDTVYVYGLQGNVLVSRDFGDSWTRLHSRSESVLAGAAVVREGEALIVGSVGTVLRARLDAAVLEEHSVDRLRDNLAAVAVAPDGSLVLVGEKGVMRIAGDGGGSLAVAGTPALAGEH